MGRAKFLEKFAPSKYTKLNTIYVDVNFVRGTGKDDQLQEGLNGVVAFTVIG